MNILPVENQFFFKLRSDYVPKLSQNIATFLYTTLNSKNPIYQQKRIEIILLLKNLCCNGEHIKIDESNYDCFVRCSSHILNPSITPGDNTSTLHNSSVILELCDFSNHLFANKEKKIKLLDAIEKRDALKYANNSLFDSDYLNLRSETLSDFLHSLNRESSCIKAIKKLEIESTIGVISESQDFREKRIVFGYSLLNLSETDVCLCVLCTILEQLSSASDLNCYEVDFINYIWKNHKKWPIKISQIILEHFKFIYEKHFIVLCQNVLQRNALNEVSHDCRNILNFSIDNVRLRKNISNLCYELFGYSNYNTFLYEFLIKNNLIN